MSKTAIVLGATGLTGNYLVENLLQDNRYEKVKVFVRRKTEHEHPKLEEYLCDLLDVKSYQKHFTGNEVLCCIGTTAAKTPDKEQYKAIDYGIPVHTAALSKTRGIRTFIVVSALGANTQSRIFYNRLKGEMEKAVLEKGPERIFILQPSLIEGKRNEKRIGEWIGKQLFKAANFLLMGPLRKYRSIHARDVAIAMIKLANGTQAPGIIPSDGIYRIANSKK
ncbi:NAD(P)H-binding protein [Ascidiimonas aurantiaca]|uniref:NAD(P)H-binding protein n=1 Tax=Ascidiimonas aurantiaca TaxID=1685432 RepID=UPI0030EBD197